MLEAVILVSSTAFGSEVVGPPAAERGRQTGEVRRAGGRPDGCSTWLDSHSAPADTPFQRSLSPWGGALRQRFIDLQTESQHLCLYNLQKSGIIVTLAVFI